MLMAAEKRENALEDVALVEGTQKLSNLYSLDIYALPREPRQVQPVDICAAVEVVFIREPSQSGRPSTVDLIKMGSFVRKKNIVSV
jgi:hypothetical protein